jgi:hypothetical protein
MLEAIGLTKCLDTLVDRADERPAKLINAELQ